MNEGYNSEQSAIESASGDKITGTEEDDEGNTLYIGQDPYDQYFIVNGEIKHDNFQKGIKSVTIGMLKHYGDGQNHSADDDMYEAFKPKSSFDDYKIGDNVTVAGKKAKITNMKMDDESGERRARVRFEDGTTEEVSINSLDESQLEEDMGGVRQNLGQEVVQKYGYQLKPIFDKYKESNIEWSQILKQYGSNSPEFKEVNDINKKLSSGFKNAALNGAAIMLKAKGASDTQIRNYFSEYGYFEDWVSDFMDELMDELGKSQQNENTMTTNEGRSAEDLKQAQVEKAYDHLEKMKANTRLFSKEDIKKAEDRIEKLEAELDALAAKATNESLDEATVRRWQHYAGIK